MTDSDESDNETVPKVLPEVKFLPETLPHRALKMSESENLESQMSPTRDSFFSPHQSQEEFIPMSEMKENSNNLNI